MRLIGSIGPRASSATTVADSTLHLTHAVCRSVTTGWTQIPFTIPLTSHPRPHAWCAPCCAQVYHYWVDTNPIYDPLLHRFRLHHTHPLKDLRAMRAAARLFVGGGGYEGFVGGRSAYPWEVGAQRVKVHLFMAGQSYEGFVEVGPPGMKQPYFEGSRNQWKRHSTPIQPVCCPLHLFSSAYLACAYLICKVCRGNNNGGVRALAQVVMIWAFMTAITLKCYRAEGDKS
eukprot:1158250-Pelagomonas_calceolata.AAC.3